MKIERGMIPPPGTAPGGSDIGGLGIKINHEKSMAVSTQNPVATLKNNRRQHDRK
jgi:hypothetical protein